MRAEYVAFPETIQHSAETGLRHVYVVGMNEIGPGDVIATMWRVSVVHRADSGNTVEDLAVGLAALEVAGEEEFQVVEQRSELEAVVQRSC